MEKMYSFFSFFLFNSSSMVVDEKYESMWVGKYQHNQIFSYLFSVFISSPKGQIKFLQILNIRHKVSRSYKVALMNIQLWTNAYSRLPIFIQKFSRGCLETNWFENCLILKRINYHMQGEHKLKFWFKNIHKFQNCSIAFVMVSSSTY